VAETDVVTLPVKKGNGKHQTFEEFVAKEKERLNGAKEEAQAKLDAAQEELNHIAMELKGIEAYELAKQGKLDLTPPAEKKERKPRDPNAPKRTRQGGKRDEVLQAIKDAGEDGMTRADVIEHFHVKGDKKGEQSVSNALSNLKKDGKLNQLANKAYVAV
jgi:hypothetical protein